MSRKLDVPTTIRRGELEYVLTPASAHNALIKQIRRESDALRFPPPDRIGQLPSDAQRRVLWRIATCPVPVEWRGDLRFNFNTDAEAGFAIGLPFAPIFGRLQMKGLWLTGLLKRVGKSDRVVPSDRAAAYVVEAQLSSEPLRWQAIVEMQPDMEKIWEDFRVACETTPFEQRPPRPPSRLTAKMIDNRVAAMQGRMR